MNHLAQVVNRAEADRVYWGRADEDGVPYLGPRPPLLTDAEYEERAVRVPYPRNGFFDLSDPTQNQSYLNVLQGVANGWFEKVYLERDLELRELKGRVYVEWIEYYMRDGRPTPFAVPGEPQGWTLAPPPAWPASPSPSAPKTP